MLLYYIELYYIELSTTLIEILVGNSIKTEHISL